MRANGGPNRLRNIAVPAPTFGGKDWGRGHTAVIFIFWCFTQVAIYGTLLAYGSLLRESRE